MKNEEKAELMQKISDHQQTMWFGIIFAILFCWTGIGLIIGLVIAIIGHELKTKKQIKLNCE